MQEMPFNTVDKHRRGIFAAKSLNITKNKDIKRINLWLRNLLLQTQRGKNFKTLSGFSMNYLNIHIPVNNFKAELVTRTTYGAGVPAADIFLPEATSLEYKHVVFRKP
jgi:hypothetical protein